jgi:hypothetical protein
VREGYTQEPQTITDKIIEGAAAERLKRCFHGQKDLTPGDARPDLFQVPEDGFPDGVRERVRLSASRFGPGQINHLVFPVQVLQFHATDFADPHAVNSEEHDRAIPDVLGLIAF